MAINASSAKAIIKTAALHLWPNLPEHELWWWKHIAEVSFVKIIISTTIWARRPTLNWIAFEINPSYIRYLTFLSNLVLNLRKIHFRSNNSASANSIKFIDVIYLIVVRNALFAQNEVISHFYLTIEAIPLVANWKIPGNCGIWFRKLNTFAIASGVLVGKSFS